jgi:hypothetical protein
MSDTVVTVHFVSDFVKIRMWGHFSNPGGWFAFDRGIAAGCTTGKGHTFVCLTFGFNINLELRDFKHDQGNLICVW